MKKLILDFMNDEDTNNIWFGLCLGCLVFMGIAANMGWIY